MRTMRGLPVPMSSPDHAATVWSSTFIPSKSPFADFGPDGYSVAWVDTPKGRIQVLVDGARPAPGTVGSLVTRTFDDLEIDVFCAGAQ